MASPVVLVLASVRNAFLTVGTGEHTVNGTLSILALFVDGLVAWVTRLCSRMGEASEDLVS